MQQRPQVEYSRKSLMLFPYHLSDVIVRVLNVTPFLYYVGMLEYLMEHEKSYDSLPNFTAADCKNRLTRFSSLFLRLTALVVVFILYLFSLAQKALETCRHRQTDRQADEGRHTENWTGRWTKWKGRQTDEKIGRQVDGRIEEKVAKQA